MRIAIFGNKHHIKSEQLKEILGILHDNNAEVYMQGCYYRSLPEVLSSSFSIAGLIEHDEFDVDLVISIGGDGTFLRTAALIGKKDIPIIGINAGRLGFLADIGDDDMESTLTDIFAGRYRIEERTRLRLSTPHQDFCGLNYALNEVAVFKQDTSSMILVHAYINDEYLTSYEADGLVVATPTGSTAYSLSAGGPIMMPTAPNFILTAIAPHSLSSRPLVVEDDCVITLDVESRNGCFLVSLDGRSTAFKAGTRLTIRKGDFNQKFIKRLGHTFYGTLRDKLKWGADPRR